MNKELTHSRDTETRILQAAEKEFLEKGYAGARTVSIAEAAGVTHAMLHYYYRTKDNLFEKIVSDKMHMLGNIILSAIGDEDLPLEERVRQGVERHFDFLFANRDLPRFIINELYAQPGHSGVLKTSVREMVNHVLNNLQRQIDENAAGGKCLQIDARMLLMDIVSLNVFPFVAAPIISGAMVDFQENYDDFLVARKRENVETILRKLKIS